jgi:small subunit ribosomal protein S29
MRKRKPVERSRPPAVGERKALRKRIVLSNTNALEVPGMQDLSEETMLDSRLRGSVVGLPLPMLNQLLAVQAFKPTQGWSIFRRPGTVLRRETLEMGRLVNRIGEEKGKVFKKIITGVRGSGKSVYLLQAMAMGFLKNWIVVTVPEPQDLVIAHTAYGTLPGSNPVQYVQNAATAALLSRTAIANKEVLSGLHISQNHEGLKSLLQPNMTLEDLARLGVQTPSIAWPVFQALWAELTATEAAGNANIGKPFKPRPPMLVTVDGLSHWMTNSRYRSAEYEPIHAHDLVFVKHFLSLLQPTTSKPTLPNGGLLLYATSASNNPTIYSFDIALKQIIASQNGIDPSSQDFPRLDPYAKIDERVLNLFNNQARSTEAGEFEVRSLGGFTTDEARGLLEHFACSGLLREKVTEELVGEKWSLAGGGIIGEMERIARRLRAIV